MGMVDAEATGHNSPVRPTASIFMFLETFFHPPHPIEQGLCFHGAYADRDCRGGAQQPA